MALTATVQSVYPPERTWDEVIVPTLRKRMESCVIDIDQLTYCACRPGR